MRQEEEYEIISDSGENVDDPDEFRPELHFSRQERRWIALGALKSALLIGAVYVGVLGVIIWLLLKVWM